MERIFVHYFRYRVQKWMMFFFENIKKRIPFGLCFCCANPHWNFNFAIWVFVSHLFIFIIVSRLYDVPNISGDFYWIILSFHIHSFTIIFAHSTQQISRTNKYTTNKTSQQINI
jgi:hypothetical protein